MKIKNTHNRTESDNACQTKAKKQHGIWKYLMPAGSSYIPHKQTF